MEPPPESTPEAVLDHIGPAPTSSAARQRRAGPLLDAIEAAADRLDGVRVHQMHALHDRPYLHGAYGDRLRHVSYFLSHVTRPCFRGGHRRPRAQQLQRDARHPHASARRDPLVLAAASPPDRHGYFSLGLNADYVASFIGRARFFLEANPADAAHLRAQPGPRQPGRRLGRVRLPTRRGATAGADRGRRPDRRLRRRADPGRRHAPDRHRRPSRTRSWPRSGTTATSACTPSCSPTASWTSSSAGSSPAWPSSSTAPRPSARSPSAPGACTTSSTRTPPSSSGRSAT